MKKILLIGADEALQGAIAEMLAPEEVELLYAENVQTGLAKAQSALPHLVICDLQNPEIDCSTLVCALRQDAKTLLMPLLLLTMPSSLTEARQGMDLGADDYLMKPFEPGSPARRDSGPPTTARELDCGPRAAARVDPIAATGACGKSASS